MGVPFSSKEVQVITVDFAIALALCAAAGVALSMRAYHIAMALCAAASAAAGMTWVALSHGPGDGVAVIFAPPCFVAALFFCAYAAWPLLKSVPERRAQRVRGHRAVPTPALQPAGAD